MTYKPVEAHKIEYSISHGMIGLFPYPDKFWDSKGIAVYIPHEDTNKSLFVRSTSKIHRMESGPPALMYKASIGKDAEEGWDTLLSELKIKRTSKRIKKIKVSEEVTNWIRCLNTADNPPKGIVELLK